MAHYSTQHTAFPKAGNFLTRTLARIGNSIVNHSIGNDLARDADALQALNDSQLEARGLKRREIPRHAFRNTLWT